MTDLIVSDERTLRGVLWRKVVDLVDRMTLRELGLGLVLLAVATTYSSFLLDDGVLVTRIAQWRGGVVPSLVLVNVIVFNVPRAYRFLRDAWEAMPVAAPIEQGTERLEGIPTAELLEHVFRRGTFKRVDVEARFGIARHRHAALADALERVGILARGENNSRVLDPSMTIDRAAELLAGKRSAEELEIPINIVRPLPSRAPIFTRTEVAQTA